MLYLRLLELIDYLTYRRCNLCDEIKLGGICDYCDPIQFGCQFQLQLLV